MNFKNYTIEEAYYMLEGDTTISRYFLEEDQKLLGMIKAKLPYKKLVNYCLNNW